MELRIIAKVNAEAIDKGPTEIENLVEGLCVRMVLGIRTFS